MGLDLADIREWLDRGDELYWIPTGYMLVDPFTKHFSETPLLDQFLRDYRYNFSDQYGALPR